MTQRIWISRILALLIVAGLALLTSGFGMGIQTAAPLAVEAGSESPLQAAARLTAAAGGNLSIRYAQATGVARFVRATGDATLPLSGSPSSLEDKAYAFFEQYGATFGVLSPRAELVVTQVTSDEYGSDVRMSQVFRNLPVFNAELIVHFDSAGSITAANGTFIPAIKVHTTPVIGAGQAANQAITTVASQLGVNAAALSAETPVLGVTKAGLAEDVPGPQALAWKTTVTGPAVRQFVFIDAITGQTVELFNALPTELHRENYNMLEQSNYDLAVRCRFEGDSASNEPDCDNAFEFSGDTYNFFFNGFRRDSFDNRGAALKSFVHFFDPLICPNAFWNGQFMTYCSTFPHDDVAGHEIAHGVTEYSANLIYAFQPGALNESFSDIFGETIDLLNSEENEAGEEWRIGEGIEPGGFRDMADPTTFGDPDSCTSPNYLCDSSDSGGVHTNSGVPNKAYYLMVAGGTHNGYTVRGLGFTKAAAIQYRALTRYLSVYSSFADDYEALLASCRDLRNKKLNDPDPETGGGRASDRVTKDDCAQVQNAIDAVQLATPVCTTFVPSPAGPLCASGETVASLFFDDHESGNLGWTASYDTTRYGGQQWMVVSDIVSSGTHAWRVNDELTSCDPGNDATADVYLVSPQVNLSGSNRPVLRFLHDFFTEGGFDGGTVEININGLWTKLESRDFTLNPYNANMSLTSTAPNWTALSRQVFTGYRHPADFPALTYYESRVNLASYLAQDLDKVVQFRFRFGTDFCNGTEVGWYLDDVEVYECRLP